MEPIYQKTYTVTSAAIDRWGRLRPTEILRYAQEVAVEHSSRLDVGLETLEQHNLFWAIVRNKVQITRLPRENEVIRVETWPMPTTRIAYPRSTVAYDEAGKEIFRSLSLWVLMDRESRAMILPGKSGVDVQGLIRGNELTLPGSLLPHRTDRHMTRTPRFSDLDTNGHVNNTRYMDWVCDLLPGDFHRDHPIREFTLCYHSEALENQALDLGWEMAEGPALRMETVRDDGGRTPHRIFSAEVLFE